MSDIDDWGSGEATPSSSDNWGTDTSDDWGSSNVGTSDDSWGTDTSDDNWGSGDIDSDDDWGSNNASTSDDDWGSNNASTSDDDWGSNNASWGSDDIGSHSQDTQPQQEVNLPPINMGYKTVGIVVAVILVAIALIIYSISNMSANKATQQTQQPVVEQQQEEEPQEQQSTGGTDFKEVPEETNIDYSKDIISAQGTVSSMRRYLQDSQVIYCIDLNISMGQIVHYYCGYDVFKQVKVGDVLKVQYQQVSDTCYSVCNISK